jgi:hypothetical protein
LTVLATIRADGTMQKPFIIYPGKKQDLPKAIEEKFDHSKAHFGKTESGWMSHEVRNIKIFLAKL